MPNCDLAFENSTVSGNIIGEIKSIKNPTKCDLEVDEVKELINDHPIGEVEINLKNKKLGSFIKRNIHPNGWFFS